MASPTTSEPAPATCDGPVLNLINKRIRALRKKLNRITQMESSLSQGKPLNSEQLEVFRSKPSVVASLEELEKLRPSLVSALQEELSLQPQHHHHQSPAASLPSLPPEPSDASVPDTDIADLIHLLYFGTMFAVASQGDYTSTMLTRIHERSCCLTYDYVTDDDDRPLSDQDLDLIASLSGFLVSRPKDSGLSHEKALRDCLEHAKLWLARSDSPVEPGSTVTYAALRERLNKIMSLEYFTTMPEMKAPVEVAAAAAAGNYAPFQVQETFVPVQIEGSVGQVEQKEEVVETDFSRHEAADESAPPNELPKDEVTGEEPAEYTLDQQENISALDEELDNQKEIEPKDQQYVPRRNYQNYRGGRGSGGGRRGFPNGRGGRTGGRAGGGGGYQNGRGHYYDQPGNYYERNYYNNQRGGRGGRGGMHPFNSHGSGGQGSHAPSDIGVAS
ncbi:hypothetical protein MLD38_002428 [Melastoma candidum]|uniref:Uncharacterized protein n=1 Tax=Melastoma candidum TaxID=119954 RepID=A0ACB9RZA9_9MYRT|nr:hypothetical protein MLD38_002428 [Melastoma candidum]